MPDAFDTAVAEVEGQGAPGSASEPENSTADVDDASRPNSNGTPASSGAPRSGRGGRRPGAGRPRKSGNQTTATGSASAVQDPPALPAPPSAESIQAAAQILARLDQVLSRRMRTDPVTPEELHQGGEAFAPVFEHYFGQLAEKGGMWAAPTAWVLLTYGPRAIERIEQQRAEKNQTLASDAGEMPTAEGGAPPGAPFSDEESRGALRLGFVASPAR